MKYVLLRQWDDYPESVVLGVIESNEVDGPPCIDAAWISAQWEEFKETKPDCDTEFIDWLVRSTLCSRTSLETVEVVLQ